MCIKCNYHCNLMACKTDYEKAIILKGIAYRLKTERLF